MKYKRELGFTLIEMLMVVTIIGILVAIVYPGVRTSQDTALKESFKSSKYNINNQIETFYYLKGVFPVGGKVGDGLLKDWNDDVDIYWPEGIPVTDNYGVPWTLRNGRVNPEINKGAEE